MVDLQHLAHYTMGDKALQGEVLELFHQQLLSARDAILAMPPEEREKLAHCLIGSALTVGAFSLAQLANAVAANPSGEESVQEMLREIDAVALLLGQMARTSTTADG